MCCPTRLALAVPPSAAAGSTIAPGDLEIDQPVAFEIGGQGRRGGVGCAADAGDDDAGFLAARRDQPAEAGGANGRTDLRAQGHCGVRSDGAWRHPDGFDARQRVESCPGRRARGIGQGRLDRGRPQGNGRIGEAHRRLRQGDRLGDPHRIGIQGLAQGHARQRRQDQAAQPRGGARREGGAGVTSGSRRLHLRPRLVSRPHQDFRRACYAALTGWPRMQVRAVIFLTLGADYRYRWCFDARSPITTARPLMPRDRAIRMMPRPSARARLPLLVSSAMAVVMTLV